MDGRMCGVHTPAMVASRGLAYPHFRDGVVRGERGELAAEAIGCHV
jgi:hypothetical protein